MPKVSIKICTKLHTILQDESFNNFQVVQLRDRFLEASTNNQSVSDAYKFIYRQVNRLVKKGVLKKNKSEDSKNATYQKAQQFYQTNFVINERSNDDRHPEKLLDNTEQGTVQQLKERLQQSEVDLLTSIGESEEYMRLYKSFPKMKEHLESQYMLARENSSKLLGQIKAIKSVLSHQQKSL
ncbi:response regulator [Shewanella sp. Isolate13]|uniref:response regulator n=1 Tax=Shewanella sp. Isolate13 TaxID=2908531 RepID=UPI001EFCEF3A|nr:response regulator [Shewanella sp. Isolate13]MCG9730053.1 response regulator [Shewanella sp. Isolate13]